MTMLKANVAVAAVLTVLAVSVQASAAAENCKAPMDPKSKGAALSDKLKNCNGVLKPSKNTDSDIILPAPAVNDPMAVKPKQVPGSEGVAK